MTPILVAAAMLMFQSSAATAAAPTATEAQAVESQPATAATAQKTANPKPQTTGKICHKEAVLGSRMPIRICETPQETASRKADARDILDAAQRDRLYQAR
jgi:hypothetical protein